MNKFSKFIKNPGRLYLWLTAKGLTRYVPDSLHLRITFRLSASYSCDLNNPKTFNEKLQWLKLHDRNPLYTTLVDKYAVKGWVAERIGAEHVTPTYGVWENVEDINLDDLPERFVLKTNHDCGGIAICRDRSTFDFEAAKKKLAKHLKRNYYWGCREWPYKNVKPLVFAEEYLDPKTQQQQITGDDIDLVDYKVMCFGGIPRYIQSHHGRSTNHTQDYYDANWKKTAMAQRGYPGLGIIENPPEKLEEMLRLSRILSRGFAHVRVDWFICDGVLIFGEMTFFDAGGFAPFEREEDDLMLGDLIDLDLAYSNKGALE